MSTVKGDGAGENGKKRSRSFARAMAMGAMAFAVAVAVLGCTTAPPSPQTSVTVGEYPISASMQTGTTDRGLYRSVTPFEHADPERTHVYPADFGGSLQSPERNVVVARQFAGRFPAPYNIVTREPHELFLYGGTVAGLAQSEVAYLVKYDTRSGAIVWERTLRNAGDLGEMIWPGLVTVHGNGDLYAIFSQQLARINPDTGDIIKQVQLPLPEGALAENIVYNGFTVLDSGLLVTKSFGRQEGCTEDSPCDESEFGPIPVSLVVVVDPESLDVVAQYQLDEGSGGRITSTNRNGRDFIFVPGTDAILRMDWDGEELRMSRDWGPLFYMKEGQTLASAPIVMNDWIVFQTNASPSEVPLSVVAVSIYDSDRVIRIDPFADSAIPASVIPSALTVDPANNRIYTMDTGPGQIAAVDLVDESELRIAWIVDQRTVSHTSLVGPPDERVFVASELENLPLPVLINRLDDGTLREQIVWRRASDGKELARSELMPILTPGVPVAPGFFGTWYYLRLDGVLTELSVFERGE